MTRFEKKYRKGGPKPLITSTEMELRAKPHSVEERDAKYLAPSWDEIYDLMIDLTEKVRASAFNPDVIVGVSRGGWPPARIISDLLSNAHVANIRVEFYKDIGVRSRKPQITQPVTSDVRHRRVLVVDDVADTGLSLRAVMSHVRRKGAADARACTIYYKPHSIFLPDYYAKKTSSWVVFPWERLETIRLISKKYKNKKDGNARYVREELRGSGIPPRLINRLMKLNQSY